MKILQYGEGGFLRTFAEAYFDDLNKKQGGDYEVCVVKPIPFGSLENFKKQGNKYHIVLRGKENGCDIERVYAIDSIAQVIDPFTDGEAYYALAKDEDLKIIVSNTTEAGIRFCADDAFDGFETITYPAKLTKFLYKRFRAGLGGVYLLPVELIDDNATVLKKCVDAYISLWNLPQEFALWNDRNNFYCNTLVDRIVSGYPRDEQTRAHLEALIGEKDALLSVGEPFGLWAIEKKGQIADYIKEGVHNIEAVLTEDIGYYKKRKVRVLNGSHTNLVAAGIMLGKETVYDCMRDEALFAFVSDTLTEEIIPFVSSDKEATTAFAQSVKERFFNPYLNHQLKSIALNSVSKWRARVLPSFKDYYAAHKKIPHRLTVGLSYLLALYYTRTQELQDDATVLEIFAKKTPLREVLQSEKLWGEDLSKYKSLEKTVEEKIRKIRAGERLL